MATFDVSSEVGTLRQVILHRPGRELERLTPSNMRELLFDDVLWIDAAKEEHDAFHAALDDRGVTVHLLHDLLAQVLEVAEARRFVVDRVVTPFTRSATIVTPMHDWLSDLESGELATLFVGGILKADLPASLPESLWSSSLYADDFVLPPLPNHLFTRDTSCWVHDGVSINPMNKPARRRETLHYQAIYRWHPMFAEPMDDDPDDPGSPPRIWYGADADEPRHPATIEGGDVLVVAADTVLIGMSERTTATGIENLAQPLLEEGRIERVLVLELPRRRAFMHLDTVMTMVDASSFTIYPNLPRDGRVFELTRGDQPGRLAVRRLDAGIQQALSEALALDVRFLEPAMSAHEAEREQWDDGNNVLALEPGVVLAYERNLATNAMLEANDVEVIRIRGNELGRGRGGPRCMSCPVEREPLGGAPSSR